MAAPAFNSLRLPSFVCTVISSAVLVACGGGGAGSDSSAGSITASSTSATAQANSASPDGSLGSLLAESAQAKALAITRTGSASALTVDFYVSPTGKDSWTGTLAAANAPATDGPFLTIAAAQNAARAKLAAMASGSASRLPVRVFMQPGTYALSAPLAFTQADSGTPAAPVSYQAVTAGTVVISGGAQLSQTTAASGSAPAVFANPASAGTDFSGGGQLYVNGVRATLARQPNVGAFAFVQKQVVLPTEPSAEPGREAFAPTADVLNWVNGLSSSDKARAVVNVMQSWTSSKHHLASGAPSGAIRVTPRAYWGFLSMGTSQRFYVENVVSALDAPGEFIQDASGVKYIPTTLQQGSTLTAVMPVLERLVTITGDRSNAKYVHDLQFKGLSFAYTRQTTPSAGYLDHQAATYVSAAIEVDGADGVTIDGCKLYGLAGAGVWFRNAVRNSKITNSTMTDIGGGAVKVGSVSGETNPFVTGSNSITGNRLGETGKEFLGAVGVWVGQSFNNVVANNLIYNTTYSGISVGWDWSMGTPTSGGNSIADNLLVNIGGGNLDDMAGIYTTGVSPGTVISGNVIREVRAYGSYGAGAWGIYGDIGSSSLNISENIVLGVDNGSFQIATGRGNTVQNNLLGLGDVGEVLLGTDDPQAALSLVGNTLIPKVAKPLLGYAKAPNASWSGNTISSSFWNGTLDTTLCGSGCTLAAVGVTATTNPRGITLSGGDSSMIARVAKVAAKAGPLDLADATSVVSAAAQKPPVFIAPPISYTLDMAGTALGAQPNGLWYSSAASSGAITMVADSAAPNGRCLQFVDSPTNPNPWDPHAYASLNHNTGTTTGEFSIRIDAQSNFDHMWRDNDTQYKTGPSINVTAAGVKVNGQVVAPVTVGDWTKIKITAPLNGTGTSWTLSVTNSAGTTTTKTGLPFQDAGWGRLNWWGFVSDAVVNTTACVAGVVATNQQ